MNRNRHDLPAKHPVSGLRVDLAERSNCSDLEIVEGHLVCCLPNCTEKGRELVLRPFDVLFRSRRVPLYNVSELRSISKQKCSYTIEKVELHKDLVTLSSTDFLALLCRDGLKTSISPTA